MIKIETVIDLKKKSIEPIKKYDKEVLNIEKKAPITRSEAHFFYGILARGHGCKLIEKPDILCNEKERAQKIKDMRLLRVICKVTQKEFENLNEKCQMTFLIKHKKNCLIYF